MVSNIIGQDAGAKGHQAKGHGVTGQNLEIKGQEVKGEISVMKRRGSVQNNKHCSKITGQKWKVKESKVGQVKDYGVIMVVVSKVTGRNSVGWKVSGVEGRSGQRSWCHRSWCQHHRSKMLVPKVIKQKVMGSQVRTWKSKARKSKVKYQWWRGVDWSKIINTAGNSHFKNERLGSRRFGQVKDYGVIMVVVSKVTKIGMVKGQWSRRSVRSKILVS